MRLRSLGLTSVAALATCILGCGSDPKPLTRVPKGSPVAPTGNGTVTIVESIDQVPLAGQHVDAKPGDYLLRGEGISAVISKDDGIIVDFGPDGARDDIVGISPSLLDGLGAARTNVTFLGPAEGAPWALHAQYRASGIPVTLHTFFTIRDGALIIDSTVICDPGLTEVAVGVGERLHWGNVPSWVEGAGFLRREGGGYQTRFAAREPAPAPGSLAYAFGPDGGGDMFIRFGGAYLPGYFQSGRASEFYTAFPEDRGAHRIMRLTASSVSLGDAAKGLLAKEPTQQLLPTVEGIRNSVKGRARIEVAQCADEKLNKPREPYARFALGEPITVPQGCFEARVWAPGHAMTAWVPIGELETKPLSVTPSGTLIVRATSDGESGPARVQARGLDNAADPDWGDDPDMGVVLNTADTTNGFMMEPIPPGRYEILVDRGFEYSVDRTVIEVASNRTVTVDASIHRVVATPGWMSADLHLHSNPSWDAPTLLEDRIRSLVAAGVEIGVATDHNKITDYSETIRALGVEKHLASVVGDEVTTEDTQFGHFNVFPLEPGDRPLTYEHTSPRAIFAEARSRGPFFNDNVIHVNHPRMGDIGYLEVARMDRENFLGWQGRTPSAPLGFDAAELYNGDEGVSIDTVRWNMKDWYLLLDMGARLTATGNSDSHRAGFHEAGLPRTYVALKDDTPEKFDLRAFTRALREGRAIVSGGPFVNLTIDGVPIGGEVPAGTHVAVATVDAPEWMDIAYIEIIKRGKVISRLEAPFSRAVTQRHRAELSVPVELAPGDWVIAVAGGNKEMNPLFRRGVNPFGFTNPIRAIP